MNYQIYILASAFAVLSACSTNTVDPVEDSTLPKTDEELILFDKMLGLWENEDGKSYERWSKLDDNTYLSVGFQVDGADTVYTERVEIHNKNGQWISENTVPGQNDGKAIEFRVTELTGNEVHFSNPAHDFPTDIHYHLTNEKTVNAFIAGPNQAGGVDTIPIHFTRVNNH